MLNSSYNQWNTASFLYNQLDAKDRLEYQFAETVVNFIKNKLKSKK